MLINIFEGVKNSGILTKTFTKINIKNGRWIKQDINNPMIFERQFCFKNKRVYFLHTLGIKSTPSHGIHISLNYFQNQRFLWMQNSHWFQRENNIRYIINILFLIAGLIVAIKF